MEHGDLSNQVSSTLAFSVSCFMQVKAKKSLERMVSILPDAIGKVVVPLIEPLAVDCEPDTYADRMVQEFLERDWVVVCADVVPPALEGAIRKAFYKYFPQVKVELFSTFHDLRSWVRYNQVHLFYTTNQEHFARLRYLQGVNVRFFTDWQTI